ncbi:MarR family winged helix-turn-helix transcriptional regulator [Microbispora sp. CSR-4]|uniref:MarR family winged helix-turn-helix transcriptional regulator n=1 Tax=Microbispora sp. CSR-4 TaxID=2592813 RepID=UPI0011C9E2CF|nr:MarR family transcriptional regulator [Microbispora sp. CSR-4]
MTTTTATGTATGTGTDAAFATALVRMSHVVQYVFADVSREHGVTPQQAQLLCMLNDGPIGMTELSRLLHLEKSSLTGLVDRVERRGLVTRVSHPRDRRACRISLTPEGAGLGEQVHAEICARLDVLGEEMPEADRLRIATALMGVVARYTT